MKRRAIVTQTKTGKYKGQWRFKLVGDNGEVVATSGTERYHNYGDAVKTIRKYFPGFDVETK